MTVEEIAQVCHEVNRAYCQALGDNSQLTWEEAPDWQKDSAINGVLFHINYPLSGPEASHENWLKEKQEAGWSYGREKNTELKLHPCMIKFNDLPLEQQAKDYIFRSVVYALVKFWR